MEGEDEIRASFVPLRDQRRTFVHCVSMKTTFSLQLVFHAGGDNVLSIWNVLSKENFSFVLLGKQISEKKCQPEFGEMCIRGEHWGAFRHACERTTNIEFLFLENKSQKV